VNPRWFILVTLLASGCAMDREQILEKKLCDADGKCARGYRCRGGTCVTDTAANGNALRLADAGASDASPGTPR
jgi:hypothetical protein